MAIKTEIRKDWIREYTEQFGHIATAERIMRSAAYNRLSVTSKSLLFYCKVVFAHKHSFKLNRDHMIFYGFPFDCSKYIEELIKAGFLERKPGQGVKGSPSYVFSDRWKISK